MQTLPIPTRSLGISCEMVHTQKISNLETALSEGRLLSEVIPLHLSSNQCVIWYRLSCFQMGQKPSLTSGRQVEEPHLPPRKLLPEFVGDSHSAEATLTAPSNSNGIDSAFDPLSSFSESPSLFKKTEGDTVESLDGGDVSGNLPLISQGSIMEKASNIRKKNMQNGSPRAGVAASPADGKKTLNPRPQADLQTFKSSK